MAEFDSYIAAWRERRARDERARVEARDAAMVLARELADVLVTRYGAPRLRSSLSSCGSVICSGICTAS